MMLQRFYAWLTQDVAPLYLHEPDGSHCGLCGAWVAGDLGDKSYPWNWRWTICPGCIAIGEMSDDEFANYLSQTVSTPRGSLIERRRNETN